MSFCCRTSQEVRGLKRRYRIRHGQSHGRTSQEVRGLKHFCTSLPAFFPVSHLARGAWIETPMYFDESNGGKSRTSQEVRGLKPARFCRL